MGLRTVGYGKGGRASRQSGRGFTLIELAVSVAILALLASMAFPVAKLAAQRERELELRVSLRQIRSAIDAYKKAADEGRVEKKVGESGFPHSLDDLVLGLPDAKTPNKQLFFILRRLPRDPMNMDPTISAADTWGKRSSVSPADAPAEGEDVFDVYSLSPGQGLNGVPYREW